jgi:hypothetical protein
MTSETESMLSAIQMLSRDIRKAEDLKDAIHESDRYQKNIVNAATALCATSWRNAEYCTQFFTGRTLWRLHGQAVTVSAEGKVEF